MGWYSLVEKYEYKRHKRKQAVLRRLIPREQRRIIGRQGAQCPDLLVYKPDFSDFFFCEVKGRRDRIRRVQMRFFENLKAETGRPVKMVEFYKL